MKALGVAIVSLGFLILGAGGAGFDLIGPEIVGALTLAMGFGILLGVVAPEAVA